MVNGRVVVFGLDGAVWDLLEKYMADGTMPNLRSFRERARWGSMRSTIPPVTPAAWGSMATGANPGSTGIYDFEQPAESFGKFRLVTSADLNGLTFPEAVEREGGKVVLINFPTLSFPPRTSGPVLGDVLTPPEHAVFPTSLREQDPFKHYRSAPNNSLLPDIPSYIADVRDLESTRFRCASALFDRDWNLFFVMFSGMDWVQHQLFSKLPGGGEREAELARAVYKDLDRYLGYFDSGLGKEDSLMVVSDHGFETSQGTFSLNLWLADRGYLKLKFAGDEISLRVGSRRVHLSPSILNTLSHSRRLWSFSANMTRMLAGKSISVETSVPDPQRSIAHSRDFTGAIYLNLKSRFNDGALERDESEPLTERMLRELRDLALSGVIADAKRGSEVYSGKQASGAPDIVVIPSKFAFTGISSDEIRNTSKNGKGEVNSHSPDGICALASPSVQAGRVQGISILDVCPTILELLGVPIDSAVEGRSILRIETTRREEAKRKLTPEQEALIEGRLRALGYS